VILKKAGHKKGTIGANTEQKVCCARVTTETRRATQPPPPKTSLDLQDGMAAECGEESPPIPSKKGEKKEPRSSSRVSKGFTTVENNVLGGLRSRQVQKKKSRTNTFILPIEVGFGVVKKERRVQFTKDWGGVCQGKMGKTGPANNREGVSVSKKRATFGFPYMHLVQVPKGPRKACTPDTGGKGAQEIPPGFGESPVDGWAFKN